MANSEGFKILLFGLVKQAKADIERKFAEAKIAITPFEYTLLAALRHKPATIAEVAKKLGIKAPSVVPYIDALEKKHMVRRQADKQDRRKIQLQVTLTGEDLFQHILKDHPKDILNQAFYKLSKQKQAQLLSVLKELTNNLP